MSSLVHHFPRESHHRSSPTPTFAPGHQVSHHFRSYDSRSDFYSPRFGDHDLIPASGSSFIDHYNSFAAYPSTDRRNQYTSTSSHFHPSTHPSHLHHSPRHVTQKAKDSSHLPFVSVDWPLESDYYHQLVPQIHPVNETTPTPRKKMGNGMDKVLPGLYIGSVRDSKDIEQIRAHGITHIISIHDNPKKGILQDVEYLCILALDQPHQNLSQYFPRCNDFIHTARLEGGNVLIHCLAGVSRSVTILMAYLMSVTSLNWKEALKCVRTVRTIANPNLGFQRQLQEFDGRRLREERKRMAVKFQNRMFLPEDEREVRRLLLVYQSMQLEQQRATNQNEAVPQKMDHGSRRCLSANVNEGSSSSRNGSGSSSSRQAESVAAYSARQFGPLAPGRSPVVKRRTLPTPIGSSRGAKTV